MAVAATLGLIDEVVVPGRRFIVDLSQVSFMDSAALHFLRSASSSSGKAVVVRKLSPRRVLRLCIGMPISAPWVIERN
jgi:anti-anti-sigma regulatory factor